MKSPTEFPWHAMGPKVRQFIDERWRDTPSLLHTRVSLLAAAVNLARLGVLGIMSVGSGNWMAAPQ